MKNSLLLISVPIILTACGAKKDNTRLVFNNSMESIYAWTEQPKSNIIRSGVAHSGRFVCKLDTSSPYSVTFNMKVSDISKRPLKSAHISAWVYMSSLVADPYIGIQIQDSSRQTQEWIAQRAIEVIGKPGDWHKVSLNVDLSIGTRNRLGNIYRIFAVNEKVDSVLLDDMTIEFKEE